MPLEATVHSSRNTTLRTIQFVFLNFLWEPHRLNSSELINDHKNGFLDQGYDRKRFLISNSCWTLHTQSIGFLSICSVLLCASFQTDLGEVPVNCFPIFPPTTKEMERQPETKGWNICVQQIFVPLPPHQITRLLLGWKGEEQMSVWTPHLIPHGWWFQHFGRWVPVAPMDFLWSHESSCQMPNTTGKQSLSCVMFWELAALSCSIYLSSAEHSYPLIYACITAALSQQEEIAWQCHCFSVYLLLSMTGQQ